MAITIRIPTKVGAEGAFPTAWKGHKKLGVLNSKPQVKGDKLFAGKYILAVRGMDRLVNGIGPETLSFYTDSNGKKHLEVHYNGDTADYELWPDPVVWSDGPPHPDHLQLAVRVSATAGIQEPQVP